MHTIWQKGDNVELAVDVAAANKLSLSVNGKHTDELGKVPTFRNWCWYVALFSEGDVSCVVFSRDGYSIYWNDYAVRRYVS